MAAPYRGLAPATQRTFSSATTNTDGELGGETEQSARVSPLFFSGSFCLFYFIFFYFLRGEGLGPSGGD